MPKLPNPFKIPPKCHKYVPLWVSKTHFKFHILGRVCCVSIHLGQILTRHFWKKVKWWRMSYGSGIKGVGINHVFTAYWTKLPSEEERLIRDIIES